MKFKTIPVIFCLFFCFFVYSLCQEKPAKQEDHILDIFLKKSGIWSGKFTNFVNQKGGIIQRGRIRMKIAVDSEGIIRQETAFIKPDGTTSDYQGYGAIKVEGNRLKWVGNVAEDENTGNPIENHRFEGYVGDNHIYASEAYEEVFPEGKREQRTNNIHYVILSENKILWLADIRVNGQLLVFANTLLKPEKRETDEAGAALFLRKLQIQYSILSGVRIY
jgi:hypothetical protein